MSGPPLFTWRHFEADIIRCAGRWYLRYTGPVSTRLSPAAMAYEHALCHKSAPASSDGHTSVNMPGHTELTTHGFFVPLIAILSSMVASFSLGHETATAPPSLSQPMP
jgi:hypothetical protein